MTEGEIAAVAAEQLITAISCSTTLVCALIFDAIRRGCSVYRRTAYRGAERVP